MLYAAIRKGLIRINGKRTALNYRTAVGDTLSIASSLLPAEQQAEQLLQVTEQSNRDNLQRKKTSALTGRQSKKSSASDRAGCASVRQGCLSIAIPILLKTADLLIVNKPAGIPVHGSRSIDTLLSGAISELSAAAQSAAASGSGRSLSLSFKQGPLHRLDKDTTGILCFSRTLAGAQWFSQCLREKTVDKYYLGIVRGAMQTQCVTTQEAGGKTMTQCYSVAYSKDINASLILFKLITGKKHQIRKHTMSVGHPLAGDSKYNGDVLLSGCSRYQLHAWRLYFPDTRPADIPAFIEAPVFPEMERLLNRYFPDWDHRTLAQKIGV